MLRFAALLVALCALASANDDLITNLPGADLSEMPNMYSGYLDLPDTSKHVFYWFVETTSDDAENAGVALWTNGGPGCSGFIGLMTEQGPFRPQSDGTLTYNEWGWHTATNMLFIEQPVGVGFSYSDDATDYSMGDWDAARDMFDAIKVFYTKYPQFKEKPFYLTSESYGGHYLPTTTKYILDHDTDRELQFHGFFLGNPWTDPYTNAVGRVQTLYGHGLVPAPVYDKWTDSCFPKHLREPGRCLKASIEVMRDSSYPSQNIDALTYPSCDDASSFAQRLWFLHYTADAEELKNVANGGDIYTYDPCVDNYATTYLNRDDVQAAIHVSPNGTTSWSECSSSIDYNRTDGFIPMMDTYKYILNNPYNYPLKLEVYSGDDDSNCPTLGTMEWIWGLDYEQTLDWSPWYYNDTQYGYQFAGYNAQWNGGNLTFSTVHGAGHEVPTYKPEAALQRFKTFLARSF